MPDEMSQTATFRANLRKIGQRGLPFDLCFLARQLPLAAALAAALPDQTFVLDHCGVPDITGGTFAPWAAAMTDLARRPNLQVKLSGIVACCAPSSANLQTLRPWVDHVINAFTPARIIWGGDWPVVNLGPGLPGWIDMSRSLLAGLSTTEQTAIASENARALYRV